MKRHVKYGSHESSYQTLLTISQSFLSSTAHLALWAAKVDGGQVLGQASVVEEHIRLNDLLCQNARHSQHRPPRMHQLRLPVPARIQLMSLTST